MGMSNIWTADVKSGQMQSLDRFEANRKPKYFCHRIGMAFDALTGFLDQATRKEAIPNSWLPKSAPHILKQ
jgi:hypothetical protein